MKTKNANEYLHSIPKITNIVDAKKYNSDVLLIPDNVTFNFENNLIQTMGLGNDDKRAKDLLRVIEIEEPLDIKYKCTNILSPLVCIEKMSVIPWHLNTQGIVYTSLSSKGRKWVKEKIATTKYEKHPEDNFWLSCSRAIENTNSNVVGVFNRRVGGWDGSLERPVIELLGAGGHVPTIWNEKKCQMENLSITENFQKEFQEELGITIDEKEISIFGGYANEITHELVVLCGIYIPEDKIPLIYSFSSNNISENTMGIYMGDIEDVLNYYKTNPNYFAGGSKAAPYNFPNRPELMERTFKILKKN